MTSGDPVVLAIVGPTASGKSDLAMRRAREVDGEVVAIDAFTVYRGMDIGTAKPSVADRDAVPHHAIDVLDPSEEVNVAWFQRIARAAIDDVLERGRTPVLVGGSGLYFRAVVDDLRFPPTDPVVRGRLEARWADDPRGAHQHLAEVDPDAAARIEPDNLRRSVRALEVLELTGERFSTWDGAWHDHRSIYPGLAVTYLEPPTEVLRPRIAGRAEAMVAAGLLDEARRLREANPDGLSTTARQAIGYGEAFAVLDGRLAEDELAAAVSTRTWGYARRQRSWFRRDPRCVRTDD